MSRRLRAGTVLALLAALGWGLVSLDRWERPPARLLVSAQFADRRIDVFASSERLRVVVLLSPESSFDPWRGVVTARSAGREAIVPAGAGIVRWSKDWTLDVARGAAPEGFVTVLIQNGPRPAESLAEWLEAHDRARTAIATAPAEVRRLLSP